MYSRVALSTRTQTAALSRAAASRQFHASPAAFKTITETVKEKADVVRLIPHYLFVMLADTIFRSVVQVNKKLGKGLASAIETGEVATEKTKQAAGTYLDAYN